MLFWKCFFIIIYLYIYKYIKFILLKFLRLTFKND